MAKQISQKSYAEYLAQERRTEMYVWAETVAYIIPVIMAVIVSVFILWIWG